MSKIVFFSFNKVSTNIALSMNEIWKMLKKMFTHSSNLLIFKHILFLKA